MADTTVLDYKINPNFKISHHTLLLNKKVPFTSLQAKLTEDFLHDFSIDFTALLKNYSVFFRGVIKKAYGEGIRNIYVHGGYETQEFEPPKGGSKVQMYVPYTRDELSETYKEVFRLRSFTKDPDILAASDVFLNVADLYKFHKMKKGSVAQGCDKCIWMFMTAWLGSNSLNWYHNTGGLGSLLLMKNDDTNTENGRNAKWAKEKIKEVQKKENNITNIYQWSCYDWLNGTLDAAHVADKTQRYTIESLKTLDKTKFAKLFRNNDKMSATQTADCIGRMIMYMYERMQIANYKNMPYYSGNAKTEKQFTANDIGNWMRCSRDELVVIMSPDLKNFLNRWATTDLKFTDNLGGYSSKVEAALKIRIVTVDILPINLIKIGSMNRYNIHLLYETTLEDRLGQEMLKTQTHHTAYLYGTREQVPFAEIIITGGNFEPAYNDTIIDVNEVALN